MKILVISDTHSRVNRVDMLLKILKEQGIQHIIHAGDHLEDAKEIQRKYPHLTVHMVPGNCDVEGYGPETSKLIQIEDVLIFLTHGHKHNVKYEYEEVWIDAMAHDAKLAIFGHSHSAYKEKKQGIILLNPGSLAEPRDTTMPSFAIIDLEKGNIKDVKVLQLLGKDKIGKHPFF
ncbi:MAG: metallophosphoesterase family protein [Cellulosilyticaceae bacterium]